MGLRIPQDIALVSFDDHVFFPYIYPPITSLRHPLEEVGKQAVQILFNQISRKNEKTENQQVVLPLYPEIRRSCGNFLHKKH